MRYLFSFLIVLFFVVSCGGGGGQEVPPTVPSPGEGPEIISDSPECGFRREDLSFDDRSTWHLVEDFCEDGEAVVRECLFPEQIEEALQDSAHAISVTLHGSEWEFSAVQNSICHQLTGEGPYVILPGDNSDSYDPDRDGEVDEKWNMCVRAQELEYFFAHAGLRDSSRYQNPRVSLATGTTQLQLNNLYEAVGFINASLPEEFRIEVAREEVHALQGEPPAGQIYVDFARRASWVDAGGTSDDPNVRGITRYYPDSAHIWISPAFIDWSGEGLGLLAHELMHAIGFEGHIPGGVQSILWASAPPRTPLNWRTIGLLHPVDRAALEYLEVFGSLDPVEANLEGWLRDKGCQ